jgi:anti-sigma factor RsiW
MTRTTAEATVDEQRRSPMKSLMDSHGRFREFIAARLDGPLARADLRALTAHLRSCPACRQVDRDYREQRHLLRSLPAPMPPRDLWARTSTALDREVARGSYRDSGLTRGFYRAPRGLAPAAALMTSVAAVGVMAALAVMQLAPAIPSAEPPSLARATPFNVPPQKLALIGVDATDVYLYQTSVSQVCPASAPDCLLTDDFVRQPVALPRSMRARTVALSPTGGRLALVGRDAGEDVIAVVFLPAAEPGFVPTPTVAATEAATIDPTIAPTIAPTTAPASQPTDATADPSSPPSASESPATPTPSATEPTPTLSASPAITAPPATAVPAGLRVLAILEDVQSAGAPPAWSASTEMLAFSAMPADGSHGPDVYVWSPADEVARAITTDHASFFASWSGQRIVASRAVSTAEDGAEPEVVTVVIDPLTLEERVADGPSIWLPQVNPQVSHAVAWHGLIDWNGGLPDPTAGTLYMLDWADIDPFAGVSSDPTASPPPTPTDSPAPSLSPSPTADTSPTTEPEPDATPSPSPDTTPTNTKAEPSPSPTPDATPTPIAPATIPPVPAGLEPIDPERDPLSAPVIDWQVRWSSDGQVLGVWVADVPGSSWGRLVVSAIDAATADRAAQPLLSPTLARRGFTLGLSRVAWVAPSEDNADGELRIRTWSSDGVGGLRFRPHDVEEVVPAF